MIESNDEVSTILAQTYATTARAVRYYPLLMDSPAPKIWAATVQPGYDDHLIPGRTTPILGREDGALYRATFDAALGSDPHWAFITTWNEWWEHTYIEPSQLYGDQYLQMTREYAEQWKRPASQCVGDANANGIGDVVDIQTTASELPCLTYLPLVVANWRQPWPTATPTATPTPTPTEATLQTPHGVVRLPDGNTLITDGGGRGGGPPASQIRGVNVRVGAQSHWADRAETPRKDGQFDWPATQAKAQVDAGGSQVLEVNAAGNVVWSFDQGLVWAHDAHRLPNGNTLIADTSKHRIIEVDPAGEIVWSSDDISLSDGTHLLIIFSV